MENLPYVTTVGTLIKMLEKIKKAAVPTHFSREFVEKTLLMKGGTARSTMPFLKKMGLVAQDGVPTELYSQFRNDSRSGAVVATCMRSLYAPLFEMNEKVYDLPDTEVKGLIVELTGNEKTAQVTQLTLATFKALKNLAKFSDVAELDTYESDMYEEIPTPKVGSTVQVPPQVPVQQFSRNEGEAINLSYTINLNLPPTTDIEIFNAIFKALKENLLKP